MDPTQRLFFDPDLSTNGTQPRPQDPKPEGGEAEPVGDDEDEEPETERDPKPMGPKPPTNAAREL